MAARTAENKVKLSHVKAATAVAVIVPSSLPLRLMITSDYTWLDACIASCHVIV